MIPIYIKSLEQYFALVGLYFTVYCWLGKFERIIAFCPDLKIYDKLYLPHAVSVAFLHMGFTQFKLQSATNESLDIWNHFGT